jgi:hypothetical protein
MLDFVTEGALPPAASAPFEGKSSGGDAVTWDSLRV